MLKKISNIFTLKYNPTKETGLAILLWLAVTGSMRIAFAFPVFEEISIFVFCSLLTYFILGIVLPVRLIKNVEEMGITKDKWKISLLISIIFSSFLIIFPLSHCHFPKSSQIFRLTILALCGCLFEAVFFRGYLQTRLEKAFGIIPSIFLASICYALYHLSYPGWENLAAIRLLFFVGIMYSTLFLFTRNILILWPLSIPLGAMIDFFNHRLDITVYSTIGYLIILLIMVIYIFKIIVTIHHKPKFKN
ncbi:MAG: CPBP family intramembrane metalloprotease [bacterium]|nr:CPBP family intramembrane metalloprotease [bacterium]